MINLDSSKYKPHDPTEAIWLASVHEAVSKFIEDNRLPIKNIRIGRQVKAFGSRGVRSIKIEWRDEPDNINVWINGHHRENLTIDQILAYTLKSCLKWRHVTERIDPQQLVFLKLKNAA